MFGVMVLHGEILGSQYFRDAIKKIEREELACQLMAERSSQLMAERNHLMSKRNSLLMSEKFNSYT